MTQQVISAPRGSIIGITICRKCNVINKIRTSDTLVGGMYKCHYCGEEISIDKKLAK